MFHCMPSELEGEHLAAIVVSVESTQLGDDSDIMPSKMEKGESLASVSARGFSTRIPSSLPRASSPTSLVRISFCLLLSLLAKRLVKALQPGLFAWFLTLWWLMKHCYVFIKVKLTSS